MQFGKISPRYEILLWKSTFNSLQYFIETIESVYTAAGTGDNRITSLKSAVNKYSMIKRYDGKELLSIQLFVEDLIFLTDNSLLLLSLQVPEEEIKVTFEDFLEYIHKNHPNRIWLDEEEYRKLKDAEQKQ